ncbi:unnamed protein product [Nippostrongylus brasiliensis]|uniref:Conserved plasma membrane protein n=1 Tax=Nippostrongylus brasiliensis TaxID=27835 RepID=A0A0N4YFL0_NIPBR|nr:hypothetical protein Q1695_004304 [Nippostrongylus brasiliensis]VDL79145.1 unnamed protein product [Nippostrongylus brasiliensis]
MIPFGSIVEEEKSNRYAKLHVQTWIYIHSAISMVVCMLGITVGILLLLYPSWHEFFLLYRQTLTYLRRNDPAIYWMCYRIFFSCWTGMHFLHLSTVVGTILGAQMTKARLVVPQMVILVCEIGIYILGTFALVLISVTGAKVTWMALLVLLFFAFFASTNLALLVAYHRILQEKNIALRSLLATKSVHFKERRGL